MTMKSLLESFGINLADVSDIKNKLNSADTLFNNPSSDDNFSTSQIELLKKLSALDLLTASENKAAIILLTEALLEELDDKKNPRQPTQN